MTGVVPSSIVALGTAPPSASSRIIAASASMAAIQNGVAPTQVQSIAQSRPRRRTGVARTSRVFESAPCARSACSNS